MPILVRTMALLAAGLMHQLACSQADSVGAGRHRVTTVGIVRQDGSIEAPAKGAESTTLLAGVHLKSQYGKQPRTFNYGQFLNRSTATLTITLNHVGGSSHRSVRGYVNDSPVAAGGQSATFIVPPGASYWMKVEDAFAITAQANKSNVSLADVGLPSAADFDRPTGGIYLGCETWTSSTDPFLGLSTLYYYQPYTRSDKSSRSDSGQPPDPPQSVGQCQEVRVEPPDSGNADPGKATGASQQISPRN